MTRLFGTDGIRGVANEEPLTPDLAYRLGRQLVATLHEQRAVDRVRLVIGRDTRRSGPLLESALTAGVLSAGGECYAVGVMPTPAIALLTRSLDAHGGIVLSASHNPFEDNGIKLFSSEGTKFPDAWEEAIERGLAGADTAPRARGADIGRLISYDQAENDYVDFLGESSLLSDRAVIAVDNTLMQGEPYVDGIYLSENGAAIANFNAALTYDSRFEQVLIPLRDGVTLIRRTPGRR